MTGVAPTLSLGNNKCMLEATHQWLMALRPMSQMLRMAVIPEIDRRVAAGVLDPGDLPFQVLRFRWIQGDGKQEIEINDDVMRTSRRLPATSARHR